MAEWSFLSLSHCRKDFPEPVAVYLEVSCLCKKRLPQWLLGKSKMREEKERPLVTWLSKVLVLLCFSLEWAQGRVFLQVLTGSLARPRLGRGLSTAV